MSMEERNYEIGAMYKRATDALNRDIQMPPDTEMLYQFVTNAGFTVIDGTLHYQHTLQVMLNRREAIEVMESLLEQLKLNHDHEEFLVEIKGKMFQVGTVE